MIRIKFKQIAISNNLKYRKIQSYIFDNSNHPQMTDADLFLMKALKFDSASHWEGNINFFKIELTWGKASVLQLLAPNVFSWSTKCFKENIPSIKVFR